MPYQGIEAKSKNTSINDHNKTKACMSDTWDCWVHLGNKTPWRTWSSVIHQPSKPHLIQQSSNHSLRCFQMLLHKRAQVKLRGTEELQSNKKWSLKHVHYWLNLYINIWSHPMNVLHTSHFVKLELLVFQTNFNNCSSFLLLLSTFFSAVAMT